MYASHCLGDAVFNGQSVVKGGVCINQITNLPNCNSGYKNYINLYGPSGILFNIYQRLSNLQKNFDLIGLDENKNLKFTNIQTDDITSKTFELEGFSYKTVGGKLTQNIATIIEDIYTRLSNSDI